MDVGATVRRGLVGSNILLRTRLGPGHLSTQHLRCLAGKDLTKSPHPTELNGQDCGSGRPCSQPLTLE